MNLSQDAQSVLDAFNKELPPNYEAGGLPAALQALAEMFRNAYANEEYIDSADDFISDIANELKNYNANN